MSDADRGAQALRPSAELDKQFRLLVEGIQDYALLTLDGSGRVSTWNAGAERLFGRPAAAMIGQPFSRLFPGDDTGPGQAERALQAAAREGRHEEEGWLAREGEGRFWAHLVLTGVRDPQGRQLGLACVVRDVTQAEKELRDSEERFRLIAENASAAVFMLDEHSNILYVNRAGEELFGHTAGEMLHRNLAMLMPQAVRGRHRAALARYLATGRRGIPWEGVEVTGLHKSGGEIALEISFGEFFDRANRRRFVGVARDVTARKEAEQALAALSRRLLQVQEDERRRIAHELHDEVGQALTALKITLHTVHQLAPDTAAAPLLLDAAGQVDRMMQQVRSLSLELRPPMIDDLGLVEALRWHVKGVRERTGLAVHLEAGPLPERPPAAVEMACFRVVQEALTNVVRHARARSARVELRPQGGELHLTVRDDGVGFDVAAARKRGTRGASFGLLGMEERVQLLGGHFGIKSATGEGTVIHARFPPAQAAPATEQPRST